VSQAIDDVMRRFVAEAIHQGNFDVVDEIVHPSYVYRSPDEELHGREALTVFLSGYHAAFPDLRMAIDELVVADDKAVIFFTYKYAVLLGLTDACMEQVAANGAAPDMITTRQLAEKVLELYWPQTVPYAGLEGAAVLRQNSGGQEDSNGFERLVRWARVSSASCTRSHRPTRLEEEVLRRAG
jgi:hypothetical protein